MLHEMLHGMQNRFWILKHTPRANAGKHPHEFPLMRDVLQDRLCRLYADDTVLVSQSGAELEKFLYAIQRKSLEYGLRLNEDK